MSALHAFECEQTDKLLVCHAVGFPLPRIDGVDIRAFVHHLEAGHVDSAQGLVLNGQEDTVQGTQHLCVESLCTYAHTVGRDGSHLASRMTLVGRGAITVPGRVYHEDTMDREALLLYAKQAASEMHGHAEPYDVMLLGMGTVELFDEGLVHAEVPERHPLSQFMTIVLGADCSLAERVAS